MHNSVRQIVCDLITTYGRSLYEDPRRCEGLLRDTCGAHEREIFVLVTALRKGIAAKLLTVPDGVPRVGWLKQLTAWLQDTCAFTEDAARWTVATWALALGTLSPTDLDAWQTAPRASRGATQADTPPTSVLAPTLVNSIGMAFVLIPAGEFMMGSNAREAYDNEKPVHAVRISKPFYLGKYAVTQGQWQVGMGTNPSFFKGVADLPVEQVSWEDVQEFIRKLNAKEGSTKYRLPSEAEWEYAARAGTTTAYSFGDNPRQLGGYAWFDDNAGGTTHPVGHKKPNPWGLYDMHGNVWEWVQDVYGAYSADAAVDPAGPFAGSSPVLRGGCWSGVADCCRSAFRNCDAPGYRYNRLGLRLLKTAE